MEDGGGQYRPPRSISGHARALPRSPSLTFGLLTQSAVAIRLPEAHLRITSMRMYSKGQSLDCRRNLARRLDQDTPGWTENRCLSYPGLREHNLRRLDQMRTSLLPGTATYTIVQIRCYLNRSASYPFSELCPALWSPHLMTH